MMLLTGEMSMAKGVSVYYSSFQNKHNKWQNITTQSEKLQQSKLVYIQFQQDQLKYRIPHVYYFSNMIESQWNNLS